MHSLLGKPAAAEKERLCMDDMLQSYYGEFGGWQMMHFVLTSLLSNVGTRSISHDGDDIYIYADQEPK